MGAPNQVATDSGSNSTAAAAGEKSCHSNLSLPAED